MKIVIEPGARVELAPRMFASSRGGTYDIGTLPDDEQKRILSTAGVSAAAKGSKPKKSDNAEASA